MCKGIFDGLMQILFVEDKATSFLPRLYFLFYRALGSRGAGRSIAPYFC